jgi:ABC-type multidrug transport system ATPase subunit
VTVSFVGGRMHAILGGPKSGKTTLIHLLANSIAVGAEVSGDIKFDGLLPDPKEPQWKRCSLVSVENAFLPEFTVIHVLVFALKFRACLYPFMSTEMLDQIKATLAIVQLPG